MRKMRGNPFSWCEGEKDEPDEAKGAAEGARSEPAGQQERPHIETPRLGKDQPGLIG